MLSLVFSAGTASAANAATQPYPPPGTGDAVAWASLPSCTGYTWPGARDAIGLGWSGSWKVFTNTGTHAQEIAFGLPCRGGTFGNISFYYAENRVQGSGTIGLQRPRYTSINVTCLDAGGAQVTTTLAAPANFGDDVAGVNIRGFSMNTSGGTPIVCRSLVKVIATVQSYQGSDWLIPSLATWNARDWKTSAGGYSPATSVAQLTPAGVELPIICVIDNSGADLFEVTRNVWGSMVNLPACLFVPVGWDRAGKIESEWNSGAAGELTDAYQAAVPDGLACGVLATFPTLNGPPFVVDTCTADFASLTVKTIVGWVIVLGLAALAVFRIVWAMGSKA